MTRVPVQRPIPLALALLIAVFSALVALAVSGGHDMTHAHAGHRHASPDQVESHRR